jgi:citrate synthase
MTDRTTPWIAAGEAADRLGVSRATLYAYVSRGFVRSQTSPRSTRERVYAREDVERLRRRAEEHRAPDKAAAHALQWGLPILESSIALIDGVHLYYRGQDAMRLAADRSLEEIAALIWATPVDAATADIDPALAIDRRTPFAPRAQALLAAASAIDPLALDLRTPGVARTGLRILRLLTAAAVGAWPSTTPIHQVLARRWRVSGDDGAVLRAALVLSADHELNVSSFTARCVASTGSHPYAVVIAGLSALEGPKHGGAGARVISMLQSMRRTHPLTPAIAARRRRGEPIDGFGHPMYREGDPRARLLLDSLGERYPRDAEYRFSRAFAEAAAEVTGERPNLDYALATITRVLALPEETPLMLFAIGRAVGWIGHAIEQYATDQLIRPRAKYVGIAPASGADR